MKRLIYTVGAVAAISLTGCKGESAEHRAALAMQNAADSAYNAGDYRLAITLIDSLNKSYPLEIDIRRTTDLNRTKAYEALATTEIPRLETQMAALRDSISQMQSGFRSVQPTKALPAYFVVAEAAKTEFNAGPTVQARVNDGQDAVDTPWTLAVNAGRDIGIKGLRLTLSDGAEYIMPVISADGQTGTITPENATAVGSALAANPTLTVKAAEAAGDKGKTQIKLTDAQTRAIGTAFVYSDARTRLRQMLIDRERYERMLTIARDQAANAVPAPAPQK